MVVVVVVVAMVVALMVAVMVIAVVVVVIQRRQAMNICWVAQTDADNLGGKAIIGNYEVSVLWIILDVRLF